MKRQRLLTLTALTLATGLAASGCGLLGGGDSSPSPSADNSASDQSTAPASDGASEGTSDNSADATQPTDQASDQSSDQGSDLGSDQSGDQSSEQGGSSPSALGGDDASSDSSTGGGSDATASGQRQAATQVGQDPVMKFKFQITGVAYDVDPQGANTPNGTDLVAVRIQAASTQKLFNGFGCSTFRLSTPDGITGGFSPLSNEDPLKGAGLKPLPYNAQGAESEGWCVFPAKNASTSNLTITYKRSAVRDLDGKTQKALTLSSRITVK